MARHPHNWLERDQASIEQDMLAVLAKRSPMLIEVPPPAIDEETTRENFKLFLILLAAALGGLLIGFISGVIVGLLVAP